MSGKWWIFWVNKNDLKKNCAVSGTAKAKHPTSRIRGMGRQPFSTKTLSVSIEVTLFSIGLVKRIKSDFGTGPCDV